MWCLIEFLLPETGQHRVYLIVVASHPCPAIIIFVQFIDLNCTAVQSIKHPRLINHGKKVTTNNQWPFSSRWQSRRGLSLFFHWCTSAWEHHQWAASHIPLSVSVWLWQHSWARARQPAVSSHAHQQSLLKCIDVVGYAREWDEERERKRESQVFWQWCHVTSKQNFRMIFEENLMKTLKK